MNNTLQAIDIFCHRVPRAISHLIEKSGFYEAGSRPGNDWQAYPAEGDNPEIRLQVMEKYDIEIQALSQTTPILLGANPDEAAEICSRSNDENYSLCKRYPDKFVNICMLSLLDMESAMKELERSIGDLDCRGIVVASNQKGKGLDSPEFYPIYEKMAEYDLPLFIHPTNWESYPLVDMETGLGAVNVIGWPFDTTQAVWRLIAGGVIDRYPSLKVVTHHCGGMLPFFAKRIEKTFRKILPRPVAEYWDNIYGDTALSGSLAACECGYAFFGADRMVFGSDYPFGGEEGVKNNLSSVRAMRIPDAEMAKILRENARVLLKIH